MANDDIVMGATIDVASAYNQLEFTLSYEAALYLGVMIYLGANKIPYVYNTDDARAGYVYNIAGSFID